MTRTPLQRETKRLQQSAARERRRKEQIRYRARLRNDVPEERLPWPADYFSPEVHVGSSLADPEQPFRVVSRQFGGEE